MALSDQLATLAARAKQAEERAAAAQNKARAKLEHEVEEARDDVTSTTDNLRQTAEENKGKVANWCNEVQNSWDVQIASIRRELDAKKAEHDLHAAQRRADSAEEDADDAEARLARRPGEPRACIPR